MRIIRTTVWIVTIVSAGFLFLAGNSGCTCTPPPPRSEPAAQLIDLLEGKDEAAAQDAQERLRAVTGKKFKTRQQWQDWFDKKAIKNNYMGIFQFPKGLGDRWNLINRVVWNVPSMPLDQDKIDDLNYPIGDGPGAILPPSVSPSSFRSRASSAFSSLTVSA